MASQKPCILVVDDDPIQRRFAALVLGRADVTVVEAESGADALEALERRPYALVLLDIEMPAMDGFAVARAIRARRDGAATVPILAYTASRSPDLAERIADAGIDGRVPKPCGGEQLIAALRPWLGKHDIGEERRAKLARMFGEAEFNGLLAGLAAQLHDALGAPNDGDLASRAHRVAGLAGTLGFTEVAAAWLSLSEGGVSARGRARLAALRALRVIDRRLASSAGDDQPSTSDR